MNITYIGSLYDNSGYGEAARNHIAALDSVGVQVNAQPVSFETFKSDQGKLGHLVHGLVNKYPEGNIRVIHLTPPNYQKLLKKDKYNIGYCAWETDRLPEEWVPMINALDEVWVPSEHNKAAFERSKITIPIQVMPHPFVVPEDINEENDAQVLANVTPDEFIFYSVFQWTARKGAVDMLKAYLTEFSADEKVAFVLKTYLTNPNNLQQAEKIKKMIKEVKSLLHIKALPKLLLVSSLLSRQQMKKLHQQADCYLGLVSCEGFGIPFAEAMSMGNPCITTNYGGQVDFMSSQLLVDYQMAPVYGMPWDLYKGNMNWAQPDIMDARKKMRWVYKNQKKAKETGLLGRQEIIDKLNYKRIGNKMKARLEQIAKEIK